MDFTDYLKFVLALVFVLAMMGGLAYILKRLGLDRTGGLTGGLKGNKRRLKIIEVMNIDAKHKAALIQCDDKQHLMLLNANGDTIIESNIKTPAEGTK